MRARREITVDGERFTVTRRGSDTFDYEWLTGPNPGYGFASAGAPGTDLDDDGHRASIREFLAEIDPATGHLRER